MLRTPRASMVIGAVSVWLVVSAAHAGMKVSMPGPFDNDGSPLRLISGPFNLSTTQPITGNGYFSSASYVDRRSSRLPTGPNGALERIDLVADSGLNSTSVPNVAVSAFASVDLIPIDPATFVYPAAAKTDAFQNHIRAQSRGVLAMEQTQPVTLNGVNYPAFSIYQYTPNSANATSAWYDTWSASASAQVKVNFRLDGDFSKNSHCTFAIPPCIAIVPPGINDVHAEPGTIIFRTRLAVYDLSQLVPCEDPDACGNQSLIPLNMGMFLAEYQRSSSDVLPLAYDTNFSMSFNAIAGHRYYAFGEMEAQARDGGSIDFSNTFGITRVDAPLGTLTSAAAGGDLVQFFQPVPEPRTVLLMVLGLAAMAGRVRQKRMAFAS
jgi:hypothetical protein